jgi:general secretion pathway protein A
MFERTEKKMAQPSELVGNPASTSAPIPGVAISAGQSGNLLAFFNLRRNPFTSSPHPRDLFWTPQTLQALSDLTTGLATARNLIVLSGEPGTGKTTLINHLLNSLHEREVPVAFVFNSHLDIDNLFDFILADFGIKEDASRPRNLRRTLHDWLYARHRSGQHPILIVDEAQGLSAPVLEEIRMLLNLEIEGEKLIQIVLSGQPELDALLATPQLLQLRQRIGLRCRIAPLSVAEAHDYIERRLAVGGAEPGKIFAPEALDAVYFYSGGTLRVINLLCEQSLLRAHRERIVPVSPQIVEEVAREFQFDDFKPFPRSFDFSPSMVADILPISTSPTRTRMSAISAMSAAPAHAGHSHPRINSAPAPTGILRARELSSLTSIASPLAPLPSVPRYPLSQPAPIEEKITAAEPPAQEPKQEVEIARKSVPAVEAIAENPKPARPPVAPNSVKAPKLAPPPAPPVAPPVAYAPVVITPKAATPPIATRLAEAVDPAWQKLQHYYAATSRWLRQPMPTTHLRRK